VVENEGWVLLVPYWAVWPYETILLPKTHVKRFTDLSERDITLLADIIKKTTIRYDNLFETSFPYSMGWQG